MIDIQQAWSIFTVNASTALRSNRSFYSPIRNSEYQIVEVLPDRIVISRVARQNNLTILTQAGFTNALTRLNANSGILRKTTMYRGHVIIETTIVEMLPSLLRWSNNAEYIVEIDLEENDNNEPIDIIEAINDEPERKIARQIRVRRGQLRLRANLIEIYQGRCAISGCNTIQTLQACHIVPSSVSGVNDTSNALLLRADIHDLFDSHVLGIHPITQTIQISQAITDTYYRSLHGAKLMERQGGRPLSMEALEFRWRLFTNQEVDN